MKKEKYIAIVSSIFVICLISIGYVFAQSSPLIIFGPKQYDKSKGKTITYTDTFNATATTGTYTLWVQSGAEGLSEAKNVSVSINGVEIIDSKYLRAANPVLKTISVQSTNTLKVALKGQGGNYITVKVLCEGCYPSATGTIPPQGGTVNLEGYASVIFPAGAFTANQNVAVSATSFPETESVYKNDTPGGQRLPYEIRINFGLIAPATAIDTVLYLTDTFLNSLPQNTGIEVFADMTYPTDHELLGGFEGIPFMYDPSTKSVKVTLSKEAFTNLLTLDGTYEAVVIIGTILK